MKQIGSQEFRKGYARLTEPVIVTALGRAIGTWTPVAALRRDEQPAQGGRAGKPTVGSVLEKANRAGRS